MTLMSNDAQKVQDVTLAIHTLWGAPALIVVILVLLYQQVGWATFVGLGVALLYSPVSSECVPVRCVPVSSITLLPILRV